MAKRGRGYIREFKVESVRRIAEQGRYLAEVAGGLGLSELGETDLHLIERVRLDRPLAERLQVGVPKTR